LTSVRHQINLHEDLDALLYASAVSSAFSENRTTQLTNIQQHSKHCTKTQLWECHECYAVRSLCAVNDQREASETMLQEYQHYSPQKNLR